MPNFTTLERIALLTIEHTSNAVSWSGFSWSDERRLALIEIAQKYPNIVEVKRSLLPWNTSFRLTPNGKAILHTIPAGSKRSSADRDEERKQYLLDEAAINRRHWFASATGQPLLQLTAIMMVPLFMIFVVQVYAYHHNNLMRSASNVASSLASPSASINHSSNRPKDDSHE